MHDRKKFGDWPVLLDRFAVVAPRLVPTVAAGAAQDDVVLAERVAVGAGDRRDRALERRIVERVDLRARAADEVMVVLAARVRRLETREPLTQVDTVDEPQLGQLVERAVDARDPDAATLRA